MPPIVHIAFGTDNFSQALYRLRRSALRFGIRDMRIYRPDHPAVRRATQENQEIMRHPRGAGYWLWKPYILLDTLDRVEEGTVIIYTDAGHRYIADPAPLVALAARQDIVLFHHDSFLQRHWTKRDCFVLMQADAPEYWDTRQLDASIQVFRAGTKARNFLVELQIAMRDPRILCDGPNTSGLSNLEGFRDHRHDQSIATILAVKHGVETFPTPKVVLKKAQAHAVQSAREAHPFSHNKAVVFEHHRCRNESFGIYCRRIVQEFFGFT